MAAKYRYKAVDPTGKVVSAEAEAEHRSDLVADLRKRGFTLLHLEEEGEVDVPEKEKTATSFEPFGVSSASIAFFTRQLAELTDAGLPIIQTLDSLEKLTPSARFRAAIGRIIASIQAGRGVYESFAEHPDIFTPVYLSMLKVAEASGEMSQMLHKLADHLEFELDMRSKLKAVLTYPVFVLVFSILLVYAMVSWLLPGFEPLWQSAKLDMSAYPITVVLMKLSALTKSPLDDILVFALVVGLFYGFRRLLALPEAQRAKDSLIYRTPGLRGIVRMGLMTRISHTLSTLLNVGMTLPKALELVADTAGNRIISDALHQVSRDVQQGKEVGKAFKETRVFPRLMVQMLEISARTGELGRTFERLTKYYQGRLENAIRAFSALIEPMTMVLIGGLVFIFVLGVFLPIMGVVAAMQSHM